MFGAVLKNVSKQYHLKVLNINSIHVIIYTVTKNEHNYGVLLELHMIVLSFNFIILV